MTTYILIFVLLLVTELVYFRIADRFDIIDKPNERSSHSNVVLRGGGIIFLIGAWVWSAFFGFEYPWFLAGLTLVAGVSFVDDIRSLPDSVRLVAQFAAAALAFHQLGILHWDMWWVVLLALIVYVGATNVINFMDGINGITVGYSLAVLLPLAVVNANGGYVEQSLIVSSALASLVLHLQLPAERQGEVLCRRCGVDRHCVCHAVSVGQCHYQDRGCHLADIPFGVWCGRLSDNHPPHHAAREPGRSAQEARVSDYGQ